MPAQQPIIEWLAARTISGLMLLASVAKISSAAKNDLAA
jgi:hypothetical protein